MKFPDYMHPVYIAGFIVGFMAAACEPLPVRYHWQDWTVYG